MKQPRVVGLVLYWLGLFSGAALAVDDHGDTGGTATAITTDDVVVGAMVDPAMAADWLNFSAVGGDRYDATTFNPPASFICMTEVLGPELTVSAGVPPRGRPRGCGLEVWSRRRSAAPTFRRTPQKD